MSCSHVWEYVSICYLFDALESLVHDFGLTILRITALKFLTLVYCLKVVCIQHDSSDEHPSLFGSIITFSLGRTHFLFFVWPLDSEKISMSLVETLPFLANRVYTGEAFAFVSVCLIDWLLACLLDWLLDCLWTHYLKKYRTYWPEICTQYWHWEGNGWDWKWLLSNC